MNSEVSSSLPRASPTLGHGSLAQRGAAGLTQVFLRSRSLMPTRCSRRGSRAGRIRCANQALEARHDAIDLLLLVQAAVPGGHRADLLQLCDLRLRLLFGALGLRTLAVLSSTFFQILVDASNLVDDLDMRSTWKFSSYSSSTSSAYPWTTSLTRTSVAQLVTEVDNFLDGNRRVEHDLENAALSILDALAISTSPSRVSSETDPSCAGTCAPDRGLE